MSLPAVTPYAMPTESELPDNRAAWVPEPDRAVLLIHDMQNHFLDIYHRERPPFPDLVAHIAAIRSACAQLDVPVVFTMQPGGQTREERGLLWDFWGPGVGRELDCQAFFDSLRPVASDTVIVKRKYSAFRKTDLLATMRRLRRDQLIVCGVYAHIGCLMTACDAFMEDIQAFLVADAVADFSKEFHDWALRYVAGRCAVVTTTQRLLERWGKEDSGQDREPTPSLRRQIAGLLGVPAERVGDETDLVALGLDSIRLMSLTEVWRSAGYAVTFAELAERPTLANWRRLLRERGGRHG